MQVHGWKTITKAIKEQRESCSSLKTATPCPEHQVESFMFATAGANGKMNGKSTVTLPGRCI